RFYGCEEGLSTHLNRSSSFFTLTVKPRKHLTLIMLDQVFTCRSRFLLNPDLCSGTVSLSARSDDLFHTLRTPLTMCQIFDVDLTSLLMEMHLRSSSPVTAMLRCCQIPSTDALKMRMMWHIRRINVSKLSAEVSTSH